METILQKLYSGKLDPTIYYEPRSAAYWKKEEKVKEIIKKWVERLGEDDESIFDDILTIYVEMIGIDREEAFQNGFNLAVKLMSEAYSSKLYDERGPWLD